MLNYEMLICLLFKEIQVLMEEQAIIFVPLMVFLGQAEKGSFSASLQHLADMFTSEFLATIKLSHFVRLKFILLTYIVSIPLTTKRIFSVTRGQMLVASGDWVALEHSLDYVHMLYLMLLRMSEQDS